MKEPLDELYFKWLYSQVADLEEVNPYATHWRLLKLLYTREFVWFVPNDDNRLEDGKDLRHEFIDEKNLRDVDSSWVSLGCSILELLVGLSRRLAFEAEGEPLEWFWHMLENIGLHKYDDRRRFSESTINAALDRVIWRTYEADGAGGLFPLKDAQEDQRNVELWYQLSAYVLEMT
jgi:hypothetical protein